MFYYIFVVISVFRREEIWKKLSHQKNSYDVLLSIQLHVICYVQTMNTKLQ